MRKLKRETCYFIVGKGLDEPHYIIKVNTGQNERSAVEYCKEYLEARGIRVDDWNNWKFCYESSGILYDFSNKQNLLRFNWRRVNVLY